MKAVTYKKNEISLNALDVNQDDNDDDDGYGYYEDYYDIENYNDNQYSEENHDDAGNCDGDYNRK